MAQPFIVIAASVFLALGTLHALLTLGDLRRPKAFTPPDPELRRAMQQSSIRLHSSVNLWDAWMGFNLTHSLGLVLFGAAFLHVGVFEPVAFAQSSLLQVCALLVSAIYLVLSLRFFFSKPAIGSAIGLFCFSLAVALSHG
ncbi:MAG: hypothetical protein V4792_00175 [Pseudomonadota bacterium]